MPKAEKPALFHMGPTIANNAVVGVHEKDGEMSLGVLTPVQKGQPLQPGAEIIYGVRSKDDPSTLEIISSYKVKGPPKVSSPKYRKNYDTIFGSRKNSHGLN